MGKDKEQRAIEQQPQEEEEEAAVNVENDFSGKQQEPPPSTSAGEDNEKECQRPLTRREALDLVFALLAWACTVCNVTLVVGTSAVVMLSIGGSDSSTSLPLGSYFFGASLISLTVTPWLFTWGGRKIGFLVGIALGMVGTVTGGASIFTESPALLIASSTFFGTAAGIGFFLRFAAVEVVPAYYAAHAVTLVVSGGCIAAFAGPESAQGTRLLFGQDLEYLGVFFMTGVFNVANILFTCLVHFPPIPIHEPVSRTELFNVVKTRQFIVPMLAMATGWAMMSMPMGLVRVAMGQVGFTARKSLTTIELHFLGMYSPGFFTGSLIQRFGSRNVCTVSLVLYAVALVLMLTSKEEADGTIATWMLGLIGIGIAWNFLFTAGTVWLTDIYKFDLKLKTAVQAANDCLMFGLSGCWIFSASYIFNAGGSGLDGWKTLNFVVVGLLGFVALVLAVNYQLDHFNYQLERGDTIGDPKRNDDDVLENDDTLQKAQTGCVDIDRV